MKKTQVIFIALAALLLAACSNNSYKISGNLENADGAYVYLLNYTTESTDSALVEKGQFAFEGTTESPFWGVLLMNDLSLDVIVEPASNTVVDMTQGETVEGSALNIELNTLRNKSGEAHSRIMAVGDSLGILLQEGIITQEEGMAVIQNVQEKQIGIYVDYLAEGLSIHNNDMLGVIMLNIFFSLCDDVDSRDAVIATMGETVLNHNSIKKEVEQIESVRKTAVGQPFVDFTVAQEDGTTVSLSDYVGKGRYILLDFWASWCSPCRKSVPALKEFYNENRNKNFEIVSVAVWDKIEDTRKALEEEQMPWPQIVGGEATPAEAYTVTGIPHLILFAPDGTIALRGYPEEEFFDEVKNILDNQ